MYYVKLVKRTDDLHKKQRSDIRACQALSFEILSCYYTYTQKQIDLFHMKQKEKCRPNIYVVNFLLNVYEMLNGLFFVK